MNANHNFTVQLVPAEEGGYIVEVPALPGCITQGDTFEEALANAREAIGAYLESLHARSLPIPTDDATVYARVAVVASPSAPRT